MPTSFDNEISALLRDAQAGSNEAAQILFEKYREPILYVIRRKLDRRLRRLFDSEDFLLDAFVKLFGQKKPEGQFATAQAFVAYLKKIAENKVRDAARKYLVSPRSNISNDVSLQRARSAGELTAQPEEEEPAFDDAEKERLRAQLDQLPLVYRFIMLHWLNGTKPAEIAKRVKMDVRLVYRCIESSKRQLADGSPPPKMPASQG